MNVEIYIMIKLVIEITHASFKIRYIKYVHYFI
jgi:hypothetical protein